MPNLATLFRQLSPKPPLLVGTVTAVTAVQVAVQLPDGGVLTARGTGTLGQKVFIRDGVVEGDAPDLPVVLVEV